MTEATLRKHAQDLAGQVEVVTQAKSAVEALTQRIANQESVLERLFRENNDRVQSLEALIHELKAQRPQNYNIASPLQQAAPAAGTSPGR